ncbi:MAG: tRNA pseudouridine(38-40) synthase TruA [Chlorobium sp.]|nr:tRNA pseudouridine(38-40) synthase TruA [Chlorobium phaeovibrioides]NQU46433.1 tRNA pseudouridine(38-40) synthase TruA [Chlorobium sp.]
MPNIRLDVEYDGTSFAGWQRQPNGIVTVQGEIEALLGKILQEKVNLAAAGRTDRGVHARGQVVNFSTRSVLEHSRIRHSLNCLLPSSIRITSSQLAAEEFHARFSALEREYRYFAIGEPSAVMGRYTGCSNGDVDVSVMQYLASGLRGVHDFSLFSREDRDGYGSLCTVREAGWYRHKGVMVFHIAANRFLRSMVRGIVGGMLSAGRGELQPEEYLGMLAGGEGGMRVKPAEASGLFLWRVRY